jgi:hypothetical protein
MNKLILAALTLFASSAAEAANPVTLLGVTYDAQEIRFQVSEIAGCTKNTKALYRVSIGESWPLSMRLVQESSEPCEIGSVHGAIITFTYAELGLKEGDQFVIRNSIQPRVVEVAR